MQFWNVELSAFLLAVYLESQKSLGCDSLPVCGNLALQCCSSVALKTRAFC